MTELFQKFGIEPTLVLAQVINFVLLVIVLGVLVYKPIMRILDARREKIEKSLKQAKELEERLTKVEEEIRTRRLETEKEAQQVVSEARKTAEKIKAEILTHTEEDQLRLKSEYVKELALEKEKMLEEVKGYVMHLSFLIAEKVLEKKISEETRAENLEKTIQKIKF
ncbi:ATP synthase F0 subunit B [Candidatus Peregrinibacteria bacterium CG08_land_8_20_14_0_20_41_10]|nr:MAG: ATP synthase F0 subunit B [Candidatus Peregrinibacteria bacterium CG1_02_41_10]PIS32375.1 MAG: ATP synthase F0 subunit B [Candidatus Peregrinibacteria bacterium CG08_land_8_20_14_0_20_41_10]